MFPSSVRPHKPITWGAASLAVSLLAWTLGSATVYAQPSSPPTSNAIDPPESPEFTESSETTSTEGFCSLQNSLQQDEAIILGDIPDAPYVVVVPGEGGDLLDAVRQCVPDAFQTHSRLGRYIRAGAFLNRGSAEQLSRHLRSIKLDARVVYFP